MSDYHASTICVVRRNKNDICIGSDGQITRGDIIAKNKERKVKRAKNYPVIYGVAGATPDSIIMGTLFEKELQDYSGDLQNAILSLANYLQFEEERSFEALMIAANAEHIMIVGGRGEIMIPDNEYGAIGSGGNYALAAIDALYHYTDLSAEKIVRASIEIASSICVFTNNNISIEKL